MAFIRLDAEAHSARGGIADIGASASVNMAEEYQDENRLEIARTAAVVRCLSR